MSARRRNNAGTAKQLRSKRWQVQRMIDGQQRAVPGLGTFDSKADALDWLRINADAFEASSVYSSEPLGSYGTRWIEQRDLKPRTREHYRKLWAIVTDGCEGRSSSAAGIGSIPLDRLSLRDVSSFRKSLDPLVSKRTGRKTPTRNKHVMMLLRAVLMSAKDDGDIETLPIGRGTNTSGEPRKIVPLEPSELVALVSRMPHEFRLMCMLAVYTTLRFGELTELRREDIDVDACTVDISEAVVRCEGEFIVGDPKSNAGKRLLGIPASLMPLVIEHLAEHTDESADALLFPAKLNRERHLAVSTFYGMFYPAREAIGRPDLHFHDLRHTGATMLALAGATIKELMQRLGHGSEKMSLHYTHTMKDSDKRMTASLDAIVALPPRDDDELAAARERRARHAA
jgi:integrase